MSLNTMAQRMVLEVPGLASDYARTLLDEALGDVEDNQLWSFQLQEDGWLTPGLLFGSGPGNSAGTITATPFQNTVTGDATASAAWLAYINAGTLPALTSFQIRNPYYSLYNIVSINTGNPAAIVFTLDRPWKEPGGSLLPYMIYQAYFAVAVADFKRFFAIRDTTNDWPINYWKYSQKDLAIRDAERTVFDDPVYAVPYQQDSRPGSPTLGYMLYELWPHPLSVLPYTYQYLRRGARLQNPSDTVPFPLTEDLILWKAKMAAYQWKEAQKGENVERGSGADYKFLTQAAEYRYHGKDGKGGKLKECRDKDRDMVDLFFTKFRRVPTDDMQEGFATVNGQLNVGTMN